MKKRKARTWTFQPAPDVVLMFEKLFGPIEELQRGEKSDLVNEALRLKMEDAQLSISQQKLAAERVRERLLKARKGKAGGTR